MDSRVPAELERKMDEAIGHYPPDQKRSAALPLLHLWQEHFGLINDEAVTWIAAKLGLQPINIFELVTFYPMLREKRAGKTHIRVCRTLSCAMAGSYQLMENLCAATGIQRKVDPAAAGHTPFSVSPDGNYSIEFVECLASCGTAPVCMVNDDLHENVQADNAMSILSESPAEPAVHPPHPLEQRIIFKNVGRKSWKTDIKTYLDDGGYEDLRKAVKMSRADIVNEVKTSGLRGRGGAGFPCGVKWSFIKP
ncbi:MAG: NADH-quinone oxidoreductase subunit, partial [Verrucomicrobiota bacterium]